ncbi:MAG: A/G-specific adenine glycosylase [Deltaproteobacteria bacterium]|nr:A/G-specific adenine glycosylase [Deltaproteobacteria bacterium]
MSPTPSARSRLRRALLAWYDAHARDLPWRRTRDPYAIWIAEVMLQQTRVETVIPYWERFLAQWPDAEALAGAPLDDVLAAWSGLGYYRRARLLHQGARHVAEAHGGALPADTGALRAIPGVGAYTTGAIASQAFDLPAALVDGNVARVLARVFAIEDDPKKGKGLARAWRLAEELVDRERPGAWNNALMELGATVCVPREPRCGQCPIRAACAAKREGRTHELPVVSEKPVRPRVREIAAVLRVRGGDESARVLVRRAPHGLFAGLWEPPRVSARDRHAARAELEATLGVKVRFDEAPARQVEHVLTHRHLEIAVHQGVVDRPPTAIASNAAWDAVEVVRPRDLDRRGVSTLARKLLAARRRG